MSARRAAWILAALLGASPAARPQDPPAGIVLVLVDDLRFDALEAPAEVPELRRLAREGVTFANAFVASAMCCPSRAALFTGLYPHATGVHDNKSGAGFEERLPTFPALLRAAGWETAFVGKWHLDNPGAEPVAGFDHWVGFEDQGVYFDQPLNVDGERVATRGPSADVLVERAVAWLERPREVPFLLILSFKNVHVPFAPPARHRGRLADAPIELPESLGQPPDELFATAREARLSNRNRWVAAAPEHFRDYARAYWEMLLAVDEGLGRLRAGLQSRRLLDETLLVVTGDNGYLLGEHGLAQKQVSYDPSIRVPLLVRWPGRAPAGGARDELVVLTDLMPTFLEAAGLATPPGLHGRSLLPLLAEPGGPWRDAVLHVAPWTEEPPAQRELALRSARWKYVRVRGPGVTGGTQEALFDLAADPHEVSDLAARPERAADLERLRARLDALAAEHGAPPGW